MSYKLYETYNTGLPIIQELLNIGILICNILHLINLVCNYF